MGRPADGRLHRACRAGACRLDAVRDGPAWLPLARRAIAMERERNLLPANRWKGDPIPAGVKALEREPRDGRGLGAARRQPAQRLPSSTDVFDGEMLLPRPPSSASTRRCGAYP